MGRGFYTDVDTFRVYFVHRTQKSVCLQTASTDMGRLTTGIRSEKCDVRRFRRCANVIDCTYTNLDSRAYYTPSLYTAYCS